MSSERKPREATCEDRLCGGLEEEEAGAAEDRTREDDEAILDPLVALTLDCSNDLPFLSVTLRLKDVKKKLFIKKKTGEA